jgi:hypothetical protein
MRSNREAIRTPLLPLILPINTALNTSTGDGGKREDGENRNERKRNRERKEYGEVRNRGGFEREQTGEQGVQRGKPLDNERRERKTKH